MRWRIAVVGAAVGTTAGILVARLRLWKRTWGIDPAEGLRVLPGDQIISDPIATETRGITIDAPPSAVWPWLVQMGFGRAGWYSYDQLDQRGRSIEEIRPELQAIKVGDIMPTHPDGGFEVAEIEPGRALVLRTDTALVNAQAAAARTRAPELRERMPAGVAASGAMLQQTPPDFSATWTFVVEPTLDGRTRLIERFRIWYGDGGPVARLFMPLLGYGVFVMVQKQMTGIRTRAERLAGTGRPLPEPAASIPATRPTERPTRNGKHDLAEPTEVVASQT